MLVDKMDNENVEMTTKWDASTMRKLKEKEDTASDKAYQFFREQAGCAQIKRKLHRFFSDDEESSGNVKPIYIVSKKKKS